MRLTLLTSLAVLATLASGPPAGAASPEPGEEIISMITALGFPPPGMPPNRGDEAQGPYQRLIIKDATIIDGTGAPAQGPVNIVIENDRIVALKGHGTGSLPMARISVDPDTRVIDAAGKFVLPGFIDAHVHTGTPTHAIGGGVMTDPEYVLKLWLAHGVTTVRDVGSGMGLKWTLELGRRSARGEITAPRMQAFAAFPEIMESPEAARAWVRAVRKTGADGVKFVGAAPELVRAAIDEAHKLGMKTAYHHSQVSVTRTNALDSARMGLDSLEHWYGLPEVMFDDRRVQDYPSDYLYNNEQDRFREAGRLWLQAAPPGSEKWQSTIAELIRLGLTLSPTFTEYDANRDTMRARTAEWFREYTMPYVARAFEPNPRVHGSFFFDWTTADEIAWKVNFQRWMTFVNDYKNAGGRVTVGSDSGFNYNVYGFGYVRELELLQEAGFHPLEVVRAATLSGAELLGIDKDTGTIEVGKKADLVIVDENPLANFKVLYSTGNPRLDRQTGQLGRTTGIRYTIKDGVVLDVPTLQAQVRTLVANEKARETKQQ
jgi:imidazolonepropionase-like amidohydrolase